jgi:uncharacterized protein YecE (DUF72 family)
MQIIVGTSGYSYKEWKGSFYPADLPAAKMLPFYAGQFEAVEINATFYRMPDAKLLGKWATEVPDGFTFALKAPQRITEQKKLAGAEDDVRRLFTAAEALEEKLGPVRFKLPAYLKKDPELLRSFLHVLPRGPRVAFDFRHASWFDEEIYTLLREHDAALCAADIDETVEEPHVKRPPLPTADQLPPTASWGYIRLRQPDYTDDQLGEWVQRIRERRWSETYVFFKHEDEGKGPAFARRFIARVNG